MLLDRATGDIYIGSHPSGLAYTKHKDDILHHKTQRGSYDNIPAPTEVIRIPYSNGKYDQQPYTLIMSVGNDQDGKHISASTVALKYKNEFVIGSVFEKGLMVCTDVHV